MTIIITIHQPSSQVFEMFDKYILLKIGLINLFRICLMVEGHLAFLGKIETAINLWNELGYPLPQNFNPADHFIATLAMNSQGKGRKSQAQINVI